VYISLSDNGIDSNVTSGNNVFIAWANNDTGHWNVFVAKSTEAGKTLKIMMIRAPNNGSIVDHDTQISSSGSNVYVTWWTDKTGTDIQLFASNDNGATFGKRVLNSTAIP
jgi:phenolic acid decarboxylase